MWKRTLLRALLVVQLSVVLYCVVELILLTCRRYFYHLRYDFYLYDFTWCIIFFISLGLTSLELGRLNSSNLLPSLFTISQAARLIVFQYRLWSVITFYRPHKIWLLTCGTLCLVFLVGTIWGSSTWWSWRKRGYPEILDPSEEVCQLRHLNKVHSSDRLRASSNDVVRLVGWMFEPTLREPIDPQLARWIKMVNYLIVVLKYIPGLLLIVFLMAFMPRFGSEPQRSDFNDDAEFQNWNYLRPHLRSQQLNDPTPSNNGNNTATAPVDSSRTNHIGLQTLAGDCGGAAPVRGRSPAGDISAPPERLLGPRFLCYLDEKDPKGYRTSRTSDDSTFDNSWGVTDYIFISYTRRQFYAQISGDPTLSTGQNGRIQAAVMRDTTTLTDYAIRAAKSAKVGAFWIDFECCQAEETEQWNDSVEDVYRICDIVRSAHSLVIVIGPPLSETYEHNIEGDQTTRVDWLHDWGRRLWTVPEALLTPSEHRISVYTTGVQEPEIVAKRNLASRVWDDAGTLRQLVEHYEASLSLTQLELISIALECLQRRQTEKRMNGDVTYALMGLLRQRPKVVKSDSDFQAFARLSLANNSDMLLERLICLRSNDIDAAWYDLRDTWDTRLWDIYPLCQVADVVGRYTVTLGGAQGAMIDWQKFHNVDYTSIHPRPVAWYYARRGPAFLFASLMAYFITHALLAAFSIFSPGLPHKQWTYGIIYAALSVGALCVAVWAPLLMWSFFGREIVESQARLFGVEGRPDLNVVEKHLFGRSKSRLRWVSSSDPDQRSGTVPEVLPLRGEDIRQFTLIDTLTCTAMLFEARAPPNIAIAGGREHGLLRTVLCSWNGHTKTFYKEAVVRMSTTVLDRMSKLEMFHFTLSKRGLSVEDP